MTMIEEQIEIPLADGTSEAYLYREEMGRRPGVLFLTDIGGIRDANRGMARRLAEEGYTVLMPNLFYRTSRLPVFDFPPQPGEERTDRRFAEFRLPLTPEAMERDAAAYVDFLAGRDSVAAGPFGVVGFCFSGGTAGQDRRGGLIPWRQSVHRRASEPAFPPAVHPGGALLRARGRGPQHAD